MTEVTWTVKIPASLSEEERKQLSDLLALESDEIVRGFMWAREQSQKLREQRKAERSA